MRNRKTTNEIFSAYLQDAITTKSRQSRFVRQENFSLEEVGKAHDDASSMLHDTMRDMKRVLDGMHDLTQASEVLMGLMQADPQLNASDAEDAFQMIRRAADVVDEGMDMLKQANSKFKHL